MMKRKEAKKLVRQMVLKEMYVARGIADESFENFKKEENPDKQDAFLLKEDAYRTKEKIYREILEVL
jgi:hypothetical protein